MKTYKAIAAAACLALPFVSTAAPSSCKAKLTGAAEREFPCYAELRFVNGAWSLNVDLGPGQPWDLGALFDLGAGKPEVGRLYAMKDVESVSVDGRDKHDKDSNSWTALARKKPARLGPKTVQPPRGSATVKLTAVGAEPEVHGTVTGTMKADTFNKNTKDLEVTFTF